MFHNLFINKNNNKWYNRGEIITARLKVYYQDVDTHQDRNINGRLIDVNKLVIKSVEINRNPVGFKDYLKENNDWADISTLTYVSQFAKVLSFEEIG